MSLLASIPSPAENGFHIGPLFFRAYGICYVFAVLGAVVVTTRRWEKDASRSRTRQSTSQGWLSN